MLKTFGIYCINSRFLPVAPHLYNLPAFGSLWAAEPHHFWGFESGTISEAHTIQLAKTTRSERKEKSLWVKKLRTDILSLLAIMRACSIHCTLKKLYSLPEKNRLPLHTAQANTRNESDIEKKIFSSRELDCFEIRWDLLEFGKQTSVSPVAFLGGRSKPMLHSSFLFLKRLFTEWRGPHCVPQSRMVCKCKDCWTHAYMQYNRSM